MCYDWTYRLHAQPFLRWANARAGLLTRALYSALTQTFNGDKARAAIVLVNYLASDSLIAENSDKDVLRALGDVLRFTIGGDNPIEWATCEQGKLAAALVEELVDVHDMEHAEAVSAVAGFIGGDPDTCFYMLTVLDNVMRHEDAAGYEEAQALAALPSRTSKA